MKCQVLALAIVPLLIALAVSRRGCETRDIAQRLAIDVRTVESHRRNVRERTGIDTPAEFVTYAQDRAWLKG